MIKKLIEFGVIAEGAKMIAADHVAKKIFKDYYYNHPKEFGNVNITSLSFLSQALAAHLVTLDLEEIIQYDTWEKCCKLLNDTYLFNVVKAPSKSLNKEKLKEELESAFKFAETFHTENGKYPLDIRVTRFEDDDTCDVWHDKEIFTLNEFEKLYEFIKDYTSFDCEIYVNYEKEAVSTNCGVMYNYNIHDGEIRGYVE